MANRSSDAKLKQGRRSEAAQMRETEDEQRRGVVNLVDLVNLKSIRDGPGMSGPIWWSVRASLYPPHIWVGYGGAGQPRHLG